MKARVLAVASAGGHWQQLMELRKAFERHDVTFLGTDENCADDVAPSQLHVVTDANRGEPVSMMRAALEVLQWTWRVRPDVVVTTGAAPGLLGIACGRLLGARTLWIDSIANAEQMSMSGKLAARLANVCLTQWRHLAHGGARYEGSIL